MCFLRQDFCGQEQSGGAQLNVFIVFVLLSRAPRWVSAAQAGSLPHTHTPDIYKKDATHDTTPTPHLPVQLLPGECVFTG